MTNKIKKYRMERGLTQKQLAAISKISQVTISHIETGMYVPGVDTAMLLSRALDVDIWLLFLLDDKNEGERQNVQKNRKRP